MRDSLVNSYNRISDYWAERGFPKWIPAAIGAYLLLTILLAIYWSMAPGSFDVRTTAAQRAADAGGTVVTGTVTTSALMTVTETLLEKPGGYTHNDLLLPGVWMDNMPNWEYGALIQVRDLARAMREVFSRSQSQSREDDDLSQAEPMLNFSSDSWMLPATEKEYRNALKLLDSYFRRVSDETAPEAQFYARSDNLRYWLSTVETRLGSLSQRLSASVAEQRVNTDLGGDQNASQSTRTADEMVVKTPWYEIDDVFYESRGATWALIHFLKAAEVDFADVLQNKNATVSLRQIVRELEGTQQMVFSPFILNGSGFGVLANHSLVMASYLSRANAAIIDLRDLLSQG